ncbi:MAG: replication initiation protein RepC, partial [Pseudomonadota bacterium]
GVSPDAWLAARRTMGPAQAAITLAAILERIADIRSPGGYLRALTAKAADDGFSPAPMVMALLSRREEKAA